MSDKSRPKDSGPSKSQDFEEALARLEKIVGEMEDGSLRLEDMMARFEEGQKLIQHCTRRLNEVERKIEKLVKKGETVTTEPLDTDTAGVEPAQGDDSEELF